MWFSSRLTKPLNFPTHAQDPLHIALRIEVYLGEHVTRFTAMLRSHIAKLRALPRRVCSRKHAHVSPNDDDGNWFQPFRGTHMQRHRTVLLQSWLNGSPPLWKHILTRCTGREREKPSKQKRERVCAAKYRVTSQRVAWLQQILTQATSRERSPQRPPLPGSRQTSTTSLSAGSQQRWSG